MNIPNSEQMHWLDSETMRIQGLESHELMERAASELSDYIDRNYNKERRTVIFCGSGNNGGDGLAIARILWNKGWSNIIVAAIKSFKRYSDDNILNYNRLKTISGITVLDIDSENAIPELFDGDIIIDAMFGTGLNREISGLCAEIITKINSSHAEVIAIDSPSGLSDFTVAGAGSTIVKANETLTIQSPTVSMLWPENSDVVGHLEIIGIGLDQDSLKSIDTPYKLTLGSEVASRIKTRPKFAHKGTFGHALLISGEYGKAGAAILASRACHRAGAGLVTTHVPEMLVNILQTSTPETMISIDENSKTISKIPDVTKFSAIGAGPGMGTSGTASSAIQKLLTEARCPLVLDADALNIIAKNKWIDIVPEGSILTPHPKEFERLFGKTDNSASRLKTLMDNAQKHKLVILLKGAHTAIATPEGKVWFNTSGNPGMATAGSGDTLTGIIAALLAQKYSSEDAAIIGAWIHGKAGDIAAQKIGAEMLIASDIIENIPHAFAESTRLHKL